MRNFIEDYLVNPAHAIKTAGSTPMAWADNIDEEMICQQIFSPEFQLYEEIIFGSSEEISSRGSARA